MVIPNMVEEKKKGALDSKKKTYIFNWMIHTDRYHKSEFKDTLTKP